MEQDWHLLIASAEWRPSISSYSVNFLMDQGNIGLFGGSSVAPFIDDSSNYHTIGAEIDSDDVNNISRSNFFIGMMYEFKIFVTPKDILDPNDVTTPLPCAANDCFFCPSNKSCLLDCEVNEFDLAGSCTACDDGCETCVRENSCTPCFDVECAECAGFGGVCN